MSGWHSSDSCGGAHQGVEYWGKPAQIHATHGRCSRISRSYAGKLCVICDIHTYVHTYIHTYITYDMYQHTLHTGEETSSIQTLQANRSTCRYEKYHPRCAIHTHTYIHIAYIHTYIHTYIHCIYYVSGETGWYVAPDRSIFYFILKNVSNSPLGVHRYI